MRICLMMVDFPDSPAPGIRLISYSPLSTNVMPRTKEKNLNGTIISFFIRPNLPVNICIDPDGLLVLGVDLGACATHSAGDSGNVCYS